MEPLASCPATWLASSERQHVMFAGRGRGSMRGNAVRVVATVASAMVMVMVFAGSTLGTPGGNVISAPIVARGDFVDRVDLKVKFERDGAVVVANAPDAGEVVVQEVTIGPGGTTGWHS